MKYLFTLFITLSMTLFAQTDSELERAYAKEFAFLKAQKKMLTQRYETVTQQNSDKVNGAKKELQNLQDKVLQRNLKSENIESNLYRARSNAAAIDEDTSLIESVTQQSSDSLKPYGIEIKVDPKHYKENLKDIFVEADKLITTLSTTRVEKGSFYLNDGTQINGELVKVGNIATFGVSQKVSGALVPAGDNKLKVWKAPESASSATALSKHQDLKHLDIFIYENVTTEIEDVKEKTAYSVIDSGGIIGWVIISLGVVGLLLGLFRILFLMGAGMQTHSLTKAALVVLLKDGSDSALDFLREKKGSTARLLKATIRNLDRDREHIEDIVAETILHESGRLDRFGSAIMVIAAVAPLLGLLGTVTGMIATFDIITEFGTGDPKMLSGGISIALVTTELGLIVAIPLLMIGNLLSGWAEKIKDSMEHSALHLINEYNK